MKSLTNIQNLPERERKQLFVIVLLGVLVVMIGAWVVLSQLPDKRQGKSKESLFQAVKDKTMEARAGFKDIQKQ